MFSATVVARRERGGTMQCLLTGTSTELEVPLGRRLEPRLGEIQKLTPACDALYVTEIDSALDDAPLLQSVDQTCDIGGAATHRGGEITLRHGAVLEQETTKPAEAYAPYPKWQPGRPDTWTGLPWER